MFTRWGIPKLRIARVVWDPVARFWSADCEPQALEGDRWSSVIYNISWDSKGGAVIRIVEKLEKLGVDPVPVLYTTEKAHLTQKPSPPLMYKFYQIRDNRRTVKFWPW
jgi:hypothetical protein